VSTKETEKMKDKAKDIADKAKSKAKHGIDKVKDRVEDAIDNVLLNAVRCPAKEQCTEDVSDVLPP